MGKIYFSFHHYVNGSAKYVQNAYSCERHNETKYLNCRVTSMLYIAKYNTYLKCKIPTSNEDENIN